jgi:hypothetical protein
MHSAHTKNGNVSSKHTPAPIQECKSESECTSNGTDRMFGTLEHRSVVATCRSAEKANKKIYKKIKEKKRRKENRHRDMLRGRIGDIYTRGLRLAQSVGDGVHHLNGSRKASHNITQSEHPFNAQFRLQSCAQMHRATVSVWQLWVVSSK